MICPLAIISANYNWYSFKPCIRVRLLCFSLAFPWQPFICISANHSRRLIFVQRHCGENKMSVAPIILMPALYRIKSVMDKDKLATGDSALLVMTLIYLAMQSVIFVTVA